MRYIFLFIVALLLTPFHWAQTSDPIEVPTKKDDLEELQLKSRLEDRLARDIHAYLGHGRFIVNVDVALQKIRQVVKETQTSKPSVPRNYPQALSYPN